MKTVIGYDVTNATAQEITNDDGYISCEAYDYGYDLNEQTGYGVADGEEFSTVEQFIEWAKTQEWFKLA